MRAPGKVLKKKKEKKRKETLKKKKETWARKKETKSINLSSWVILSYRAE